MYVICNIEESCIYNVYIECSLLKTYIFIYVYMLLGCTANAILIECRLPRRGRPMARRLRDGRLQRGTRADVAASEASLSESPRIREAPSSDQIRRPRVPV